MKIRTNAGEVDLTAEMVCEGMVFRWVASGPEFDLTIDREPQYVDGEAWWGASHPDGRGQVYESGIHNGSFRFLGCDPTIASRADCERYGVYGDAVAHGFARLRDGGAVDLQREMPVGSVIDRFGARLVCKPPWRLVPPNERFIGLDTRHASPEDVRRMCCGEYGPDQIDSGNRTTWAPRCTLAIGKHERHEDLATGVKWGTSSGVDTAKTNIRAHLDSAKGHFFTGSPDSIRRVLAACDLRADVHRLYPGSYRVTLEGADAVLCDAVGRWLSDNCPMDVMYDVVLTRPTCGKCAQTITDPTPMRFASDRGGGVIESVLICTRCAREIEPGTMTVRNGRIMPKFVPSNVDSMPEVRATWTGIAGLQAPTGAPQSIVERMARHDESGVLGFCAFIAGLKRWAVSPDTPSATRLVFRDSATWSEISMGADGCRCSCGATNPGLHAGDCKAPFWMRKASAAAWAVMPQGMEVAAQMGHEAAIGASVLGFFVFLRRLWDWDEDPAQVRAKREAPLVALVNACPEGLDPIGWRAAVLALHEPRSGVEGVAFFHRDEIGERISIERQLRDDEVFTLAGEIAVPAYRRAIAPRAKVAPERKQRGPTIVVDDGRDE